MGAILLDTHILLWAAAEPERLADREAELLSDTSTELLVSTISAVEIEIKRSIGKLRMDHTCGDLVRAIGADWLSLTAEHAMGLRTLPLLHRDPFDRLLVAQALTESLDFLTHDVKLAGYQEAGLRLLRVGSD